MHFSCLVASSHCPDEDAVDDLLWPWCFSNEERREARFDYCEMGGRFADFFSLDGATRLSIGDIAVTASGGARPIVWIGHRTMACGPGPGSRPVRVAAHAFGPMRPARDLVLSPGHPVLIGADANDAGGHLVPIMCLVNGTTVRRVAVDEVTYWHIELDEHDILLAENLPAESYLDWGDRAFFTEGSDHALHHPDFVVPGLAGRCRPVAIDGPVVEAERRRLDAVVATRLTLASTWPSGKDALLAV